jgi:tetratricopeptide (TPR) repeat protein
VASDQAKELRKQGIAAAKAGQTDQARQLLQQSLRIEPRNEAAWLWLVSLAREQREKFFYLNRLLEINPNSEMGLQSLQQLGMTREQLTQQVASLPARPDNRAVLANSSQTPGVPLPDQQRITQLQDEVDGIVEEYLTPPIGYTGINWVQKKSGRAGERDIWTLRGYIAAGVAAGLVATFIIGYTIVWNTPVLRGIVFVPTPTLTPTRIPPTFTPTPTPGLTPTPSPTPRLTLTPSPTVPPQIPNGAVGVPQPTALFVAAFDKGVQDAVSLIDRKRYDEALPTLQFAITQVASNFDPGPYYYAALAFIGQGKLAEAKQILLRAQDRLTDTSDGTMRGVVNGGLAYTNLLLAQKAQTDGNSQAVSDLLVEVEDQSKLAIESAPRFDVPYLALAGRFRLGRNYDEALKTLDQGLGIPELVANANLLVEKGKVYFERAEYDSAAYQAFLALYADPVAENAHQLRIETALAQDEPGLAVLYSQAYLFYYPGSVEAYRYLGDARTAEGNTDLALAAYAQGAQGLTGRERADYLISRAVLFKQNGQFNEALDDLTAAFALNDDPAVRVQRMEVAYLAGKTAVAKSDAEALLGQNVVPDSQIKFLQARILIDEAQPDAQADFKQALDLLNEVGSVPEADLQGTAAEYRARAHLNLKQYADALRAIDTALAEAETGSRHYWRGQILEGQGKRDAALREYDWVLTWSAVYNYPFLEDVTARVEKLK